MSVTEEFQGLGSFDVKLRPETPASVLEEMYGLDNDYLLSHIIITPSPLYPAEELALDITTEPDLTERVLQGDFEWTYDGGPNNDYPIHYVSAGPAPGPWKIHSPSVSGWDAYGAPYEGTRAARWQPFAGFGETSHRNRLHSLVQTVSLTPGRRYKFRFAAAVTDDSNQVFRVTLYTWTARYMARVYLASASAVIPAWPDWGLAGSRVENTDPEPPLERIGAGYQVFEYDFTMPHNEHEVTIEIEPGDPRPDFDTGEGEWLFDSVSIKPNDRPDIEVLIPAAIYTGVVERFNENRLQIEGSGMAFWLATGEDRGAVYEESMNFTNATLTEVIETLFEDVVSVKLGDITEPDNGKLFTAGDDLVANDFGIIYVTPRTALDKVCKYFEVEWRIRPNGVLDVGPAEALFVTEPKIVASRRHTLPEVHLRGLKSTDMQRVVDLDKYATRTLMLGEDDGLTIASEVVDGPPTPYRDFFGNPVRLTQLVDEPETELGNQNEFAQAHQRLATKTDIVDVNTGIYDLGLALTPGDYVWAYDTLLNIVDTENEIVFQGQIIHPKKYRVYGRTWPIRRGMGVYFRRRDGAILDLSFWIEGEEETQSIARQPEEPFPKLPTTLEEYIGVDNE